MADELIASYFDHIIRMNRWIMKEFIEFQVEGRLVGYIHQENIRYLEPYRNVFVMVNGCVTFNDENKMLKTVQGRTESVEAIADELHAKYGLFSLRRDEYFDVKATYDANPLFQIKRGSLYFFGLLNSGVHCNGYTINENGEKVMWLAKRSPNKSEYPNKLDQFVAGGGTGNLNAWDIMMKEFGEEASVPAELGDQATAVGAIGYCIQKGKELVRDIIIIFDLLLPSTFVPRPRDGEVQEFFQWSIPKVMDTVRTSLDFKDNCNLVIIDFLVRHGFITPKDKNYTSIVFGLRSLYK